MRRSTVRAPMLAAAALAAGALWQAGIAAAGPAAPGSVRQPAIAGSWYPGDPALARVEVHRLLRAASGAPTVSGRPVALVVPHAGWTYSGAAAASAFSFFAPSGLNTTAARHRESSSMCPRAPTGARQPPRRWASRDRSANTAAWDAASSS